MIFKPQPSLDSAPGGLGGEVISLQYLRAVAVLAVVFSHLPAALYRMLGLHDGHVEYPGIFGVDIFFVISGFIIYFISEKRTPPAIDFFKRRISRVAPLYWVITLAMFFMPLVSKTIGWSSNLDPMHLFTSLFFVGGVTYPGSIEDFPVYRAGWTLNYEMFFYLLFAMGLALGNVRRAVWFVLATLTVLVVAGRILGLERGSIAHFYTAPILLEFMMGVGVAAAYRWITRIPLAIGAVMVVGGFWVIWANSAPGVELPLGRAVKFGIPALVLVVGSLAFERVLRHRHVPIVKLLGDASYAIYLTHIFTLAFYEIVMERIIDFRWESLIWAYNLTGLVLSCIIGIFAHWWIEKPLINYFRKPLFHFLQNDKAKA